MKCGFCGNAKGTSHASDCVERGTVQLYDCPGGTALERRHTARLDEFDKEVATITFKRGEQYGPPRQDFERAQKIKAAVADCPDPAVRHILEMIGVKMARLCTTPTHLDSYIDIAGYARCGVMVTDDLLPGGSRYSKRPVASVAQHVDRIAFDRLLNAAELMRRYRNMDQMTQKEYIEVNDAITAAKQI